jgi:integrase
MVFVHQGVSMSSVQFDEGSKRYRIRFNFGGEEFKRSLKTRDKKIANGIKARVEETIRLIEQGRLEIPAGADPALFILSDGKLAQKPVAVRPMTLTELIDAYREKLPVGAKEATTACTEQIHFKHLVRILGGSLPVQTVTPAKVQEYIERRSQEHWRGKLIKAQTIKKETETLRQLWNWGVGLSFLTGPAPVKGVRFAKGKDRPPFQTWAEIEKAIARGGLSKEEQAELWECLFLTREQVAEVLANVKKQKAHGYVLPMFVFVAHTGARRSEMLRSRVDDFNLQEGFVRIREKKRDRTKSITFRQVNLSPPLLQVMTEWLSQHPGGQFTFCQSADKPLTWQTATKTFRRVLSGSKWAKVRGFHVFRHSFASNLAAASVDQRIIDEWMGHQTDAMRKRYRHLLPDQRRKAIEAVFPAA